MDVARVVVIALVAAVAVVAYRRTMAGPAAPRGSARRAQALGLLPRSAQNTRQVAADPELEQARAVASRGDWEPAAQLLARSRELGDWGRRSFHADVLGDHEAVRPGSWLEAWESAVGPDDPDAALIRARATVSLAWHLRGAARARETSRKQFQEFHNVLVQAPALCARAARLNPGDPSPFVTEIWAALGLGASREQMRQIWKEVTARDPHHYGAHRAALQYWCAKWRGSAGLAATFAQEAAATAPPGSLLTALPLIAWYEHHDTNAETDDFRTPSLVAMVDAALADADAAPRDHPDTASLRHLLAYFLTRQGRYDLALQQFRLVDGHVDALPWRYFDNPAAVYCVWRDRAIQGVQGRFTS